MFDDSYDSGRYTRDHHLVSGALPAGSLKIQKANISAVQLTKISFTAVTGPS